MPIVSSGLIILGGLAVLSAIVFRTSQEQPFASLNPRHWTPVWRRDAIQSLHSPGYILTTGGPALFLTGMLIHFVVAGRLW